MVNKKLTQNRTKILTICLLIAIVVASALAYIIPKLSKTESTSDLKNTSSESNQSSGKTEVPEYVTDDGSVISDVTLVEMGQYMEFATQKMKVNSARLVDTISNGNSYSNPSVAGEGAKFLVINITIENTSVAPFSYRDFSLFTSKDATIEKQYGAFSSYGEIENYIDGRELQPGIPETGNVVYKVPDGKSEFQLGGAISGTSRALHTKISL